MFSVVEGLGVTETARNGMDVVSRADHLGGHEMAQVMQPCLAEPGLIPETGERGGGLVGPVGLGPVRPLRQHKRLRAHLHPQNAARSSTRVRYWCNSATVPASIEMGARRGSWCLLDDPATAVAAGADRFLTNNPSDFPKTITEIDITYPTDLAVPTR